MKQVALVVLCITFLAGIAVAQNKTIILVRHGEKNPPVEGDKGDVDLSSEGRDRAERFARVAKRFRPGEIFATAYKRTRQTAEPIAKLRSKEIQTYDAAKHPELIDLIMKSKTKRFVIVGHSNTIPFLANLIAKKEVFRQLPDGEYGVVYVIRLARGAFKRLEIYPF